MPLGTTIENGRVHPLSGVVVQSLTNRWQTVVRAGGPALLDNASITDPTTQIVRDTTSIFSRQAGGTILLIRLGYDDALASITNPVIRVFGRTGDDAWQELPDAAGNSAITLTTAASVDATDGTLKYTKAVVAAHSVDCLGCEEILIGVQTVLAGTGVVNNSIIQVKAL